MKVSRSPTLAGVAVIDVATHVAIGVGTLVTCSSVIAIRVGAGARSKHDASLSGDRFG